MPKITCIGRASHRGLPDVGLFFEDLNLMDYLPAPEVGARGEESQKLSEI